MLCEGVVVVCVYWGGVLSYKYKYIYFALQKNNKKTNMRLMTVEECFFRCRLAVCSFFFSLNFYTNMGALAHTRAHRFTETRPFERLAASGLWAPDPGNHEDVGLSPGSSHSSAHGCDTWSGGGIYERVGRRPPSQEGHTFVCGCERGFLCKCVCVCR